MLRKSASFSKFCFLLACIFLSAVATLAQSQATTGNIEGRVTDPNGAAVPGVTVTATNQETALAKSAETDSEGIYRIIFLPPGKYRVTTTAAQGFAAANFSNVIVTVGGQTPLDMQVKPGGTTTMVDVAAEGQGSVVLLLLALFLPGAATVATQASLPVRQVSLVRTGFGSGCHGKSCVLTVAAIAVIFCL